MQTSPHIETEIEEGRHLFEAGEFDRAYRRLSRASNWLRDRGRGREALSVLEPFLAEDVQSKLSADRRGRMLGTIGLAYESLGQVKRAAELYEKSLAIARETGDRQGEGTALGNLGNAHAAPGHVEPAISLYGQVLAIARETGDRQVEGSALGNLGLAYADLGQVERAVTFHEQHLAIARETADRQGEGNALRDLGVACTRLGQAEKARASLGSALQIGREIQDPSIVDACERALHGLDSSTPG